MSSNHRRRRLLGVFYYRSPDARTRRIDKLMEEAAKIARRENERA